MAAPTPDDLAACRADAERREAERWAADLPKPRKGKRLGFVPTPLSAFTFSAGVSYGGEIAVERRLNGARTGHVLIYRRAEPGSPYTYRFTR